jgi:hypothetical protein
MSEREPAISDQILDLLLDALLQRQQERERKVPARSLEELQDRAIRKMRQQAEPAVLSQLPPTGQETEPEAGPSVIEAPPLPESESLPVTAPHDVGPPSDEPAEGTAAGKMEGITPFPDDGEITPQELPSVHLHRLLGRLFLGILLLIIVINIPFNRYGTSLARAMPDSASLIIRDGLLLKGSGEKVYVLEDNRRRWISTLDAFEEYGYRWSQVHQVDDSFLDDFEEGLPIHLLLKCETSPHIYALENGQKRWIKDIPTFEARQYVWEDVRFVSCGYLRNLPDGLPIPEDAGPPPQP